MNGRGRGRPKMSKPPVPVDWTDNQRDPRHRDSDASFCSSRPSSVGGHSRPSFIAPLNDRSLQTSAIKSVNLYLHSHSVPIVLRPPLPSVKDINETIKFLFTRLDFPLDPTEKIEEELPAILKHIGCPNAIKPSILRTPSTPHAWPTILAVIQWMVQIARYSDHILSNPVPFNQFLQSQLEAYSHFIRGEDEAAGGLELEYTKELEQQEESKKESLNFLEKEVSELEHKLLTLRSAPTQREVLEKQRSNLFEDIKKFNSVIENWSAKVSTLEKELENKRRELEVKLRENSRICDENEELKKRVEEQKVNVMDAERMKRELAAVKRDIAEAEIGRSAYEENALDLEFKESQIIKELEGLISECNQTIKRLKLVVDFQFKLDPKGSSPGEILGSDYKTKLKPLLVALEDEVKKNSMEKLEERILLEHQVGKNSAKLDAKRKQVEAFQFIIDQAEAKSSLLKKEMEEFVEKCAIEAERYREDVERKSQYVESAEREAEEMLMKYEQNLRNCIKQTDEATQMCAEELLGLIDNVSKYKEDMETKILAMRANLFKTVDSIAKTYKSSLTESPPLNSICKMLLL